MPKLVYDEYQKSFRIDSPSNAKEELSQHSIPIRHVILLELQSFMVSFLIYGNFVLAMNNIYFVA